MDKILLVLEDYAELTSLQALLMKFGWDVKGLRKAVLLKEDLRNFQPDAVIMTANGSQLNGIELSQQVRSLSSALIFLVYKQEAEIKHLEVSEFHGFFKSPIDAQTVVRTLAQRSGEKSPVIVEKFQKIFGVPFAAEQPKSSQAKPLTREVKYSQWLNSQMPELPPHDWPVKNAEVSGVEVIREFEKNEELDSDRKEFTKKLFTKT